MQSERERGRETGEERDEICKGARREKEREIGTETQIHRKRERDRDKQRWERGVSLELWGLSQSPHGCILAPQCALVAHGRFLAPQCALGAHGQDCFQWGHLRAGRG